MKKSLPPVRIAVSGKSGCGNTTVSKLVSEALGLRFINYTFRNLAGEKGITLEEMLALAGADDSWDKELDTRQVALAHENGGCVLGSRLAIWMLSDADFKVYLTASSETRARRIMKREGGTLEAVARVTADRDRRDRERFLKIYQIDNDRYDFADLVIDVNELGPKEIAERIIEQVRIKLR
jgi:cytidylate kinase